MFSKSRQFEVLIHYLAKETTFPSLTWATYYAVYIELTCCFIIACLPAIRQLADKKVMPIIRDYAMLSSDKNNSTRGVNSTAGSPGLVISRTQETWVISSRLDPNARVADDGWNSDRKDSWTGRRVVIE